MGAKIIDGKAIAAELRANVTGEVQRLSARHGVVPGLAVVLVGHDAASETYVRSKTKAVREAGMRSFDHRLPASVSQAELLSWRSRLCCLALIQAIQWSSPPRYSR